MLDRYLEQLVKELSLEPVAPADEQKRRHLKIGHLSIALQDLDPGFYFFSQIAPLPKPKREELFMALMKGNFLGQATGGATIGLMEDESFLTLSLALPYDMNYKAFRETLEDFTNFIEYWQKEVAKQQAEALK